MGRGRSKIGASLGNDSGEPINIIDSKDVWSWRHNRDNEPFVDAINGTIRDLQKDYSDIMEFVDRVYAREYGGEDAQGTLGDYDRNGKSVSINRRFTDIDRMTASYDAGVVEGFHPALGNKNGVQAVTAHEMGHAITDMIAQKNPGSFGSFESAAQQIVETAYRAYSVDKSKGKTGKLKMGTKAWAGKISGYAKDSNAECVAEAVADYYCNGKKAAEPSKYIINAIKFWNQDNRGAIPFN